MAARRWTIVCAAVTAGRYAALSGMAAGPGRNPTDHRAGARRRQHCSVRPAPAAGRAAERAAPRDAALQHRPHDAERQLRWRTRPGTRRAAAASGGGRGDRCGACAAPAQPAPVSLSPNRIARLKRFDLSWQAALAKIDANKLSTSCEGRPRDAEGDHSDQPGAARRRFRDRSHSRCRLCPSPRRSSS